MQKINDALKKISKKKFDVTKKLFDLLIENGYKLRYEKCFQDYLDYGMVIKARRDLSVELTALGYSSSVNAAFNKILKVPPYLEYAKNLPVIKEGIELIHDCGGIAVAVHPFGTARGGKHELKKGQVEDYVARLHSYGVNGIEVFYQLYDEQQIDFLEGLAKKYGLIKSIGTDFHGTDKESFKSDREYAIAMEKRGRENFVFGKIGVKADESIVKLLFKD